MLLAEDSVTIRQLLTAILRSDPAIEVVGEAADGLEAVERARSLLPDVVAMDIHMPRLDGFEATKRIMTESPRPIVIISASADAGDVEISMHALRAGALAVLRKPSGPAAPGFEQDRRLFLETIKAMSQVKVVRQWPETPPPRAAEERPRPGPGRLVCVAASTGGPAALSRLLQDLPADFGAPILVVQHMAGGFIEGLAQWLNKCCSLRVKVAEDGEVPMDGTVYLAPDGGHLGLSGRKRIALSQDPPVGGFRPAATHLFESASKAFGAELIAVVLTGMGEDGVQALPGLRRSGGLVLAQDERSSVVFGMPKAAIASGCVDRVLALPDIGRRLRELVKP